jgi:hypothetical protein
MGKHVKVHGQNGTGKTAFLKAFDAIFTGDGGRQPIKVGAEKADLWADVVDMTTGEIVWQLHRTFKDGKSELELRDGCGKKAKKSDLDREVRAVCFNLSEWLRKRGQDQIDDLARVHGVKHPVAEVESITGQPWIPLENESPFAYLDRLSADDRGIYYLKRQEAGRVVKTKEKAFEEFRLSLPTGEDEPEEDISALLQERQELDRQREDRRAALAMATDAGKSHAAAQAKLQSLRTDREKCAARIEALRKQLADEMAAHDELARRIVKGESVVTKLGEDYQSLADAAAKLPDPSSRLFDLERDITDADRNRQQIAERKQARQMAQRLAEEAEQARQQHAALEMTLTRLRDLKRHQLDGVDIGVPGVTIGDGQIMLGESTLEQGSGGQKMAVAFSMFAQSDATVKIATMDDAVLMDEETEALVMAQAEKYDVQLALAYVERGTEEMRVEVSE